MNVVSEWHDTSGRGVGREGEATVVMSIYVAMEGGVKCRQL